MKPSVRPARPHFASGPAPKPPGWSPASLADAPVGRSHRAAPGRAKLEEVIARSRALLGIPEDYRLAVMPGSDTGAFESALWSLLGARGVDVLAWDKFGADWAQDVTAELRLDDVRVLGAAYGALPDLAETDFARDVVFAWTGTSAGVSVPDGEWIAGGREGLTICDATCAVFAADLPWARLDVATWSWQKLMGGEAQHGMLALSPRAVARLESWTPPWPRPKLFRLTRAGRLDEGLFAGETINTPSMLCVEDALVSLRWIESAGGLAGMLHRARQNRAVLDRWIDASDWVEHLCREPAWRAPTPVTMRAAGPYFDALSGPELRAAVARIPALLEAEGVAFDIAAYRTAPPGLRVWSGATVEAGDLEALVAWLDWAYGEVAGRAEAGA